MKLYKNQKGFGVIEGLLIVVIIGIIGGAGYYVYNANKDNPKVSDSSIQKKENKPEQPKTKSFPELVDYGKNGITIKKASDTGKLYDTSDLFKQFMKDEIKNLQKEVDPNCQGGQEATIIVLKVYKDEFAGGSAGVCGAGAFVVWAKENSKWKQLTVTQEYLMCSFVDKHKIPHQIVDQCTDPSSPEGSNGYPLKENPN